MKSVEYKEKLEGGLLELRQALNNVNADLLTLREQKIEIGKQIAAQQGALGMLEEILKEEEEELDG